MASRALGLAAAADAKLAEPAARFPLRRRRPRRLHDDGRGRRLRLALRRGGRRAGAIAHRRHVGQVDRLGITSRRAAANSAAARRPGERCLQRSPRAGAPPGDTGLSRIGQPARLPNPGQLPEGGVLVVGASATGVQLADEISAWPSRDCRSASTCDCRGSIAAGMCSGGWRRPASGTSATTRSTI